MSPLTRCLLLLAIVCTAAVAPAADVTLLFSGYTRGEIWPCDCQIPGGLVKRATVIRQVRDAAAQSGIPVFLFDLGDITGFSFDSDPLDMGLLRVMGALSLDAAILGPEDLPASPDRIGMAQAMLGAPLLSGELGDASWPCAVSARGEQRVAVLGWPVDRMRDVGDLSALQAAATAAEVSADLTVLLCPLPEDLLQPALEEITGLDLVLSRAASPEILPSGGWSGGRAWATLRDRGEVGVVRVSVGEPHVITAFSSERVLLMADVEDDSALAALAQETMLMQTDSDTSEAQAAPSPGRLEIETEGLTWEEVPEGTVVEGRLILRNTGGEPLTIRSLRSTCRCMRLGEIPDSVAPEDSVDILVTVDTEGKRGEYRESLILTTTDNSRPLRTVPVVGRIGSPEAVAAEAGSAEHVAQ